MTQYNTLNIKLSNESSNDETNVPHKLLLTDTQVSKICNAFANGTSANLKFSKTQLSKIVQSGGFIGLNYLIAPIKGLTSLLQFINNKLKNVLQNKDKPSDTIKTVESSIKSIKKPFRAGITLTNNKIKHIIKVIKSLENRGIL